MSSTTCGTVVTSRGDAVLKVRARVKSTTRGLIFLAVLRQPGYEKTSLSMRLGVDSHRVQFLSGASISGGLSHILISMLLPLAMNSRSSSRILLTILDRLRNWPGSIISLTTRCGGARGGTKIIGRKGRLKLIVTFTAAIYLVSRHISTRSLSSSPHLKGINYSSISTTWKKLTLWSALWRLITIRSSRRYLITARSIKFKK